MASDDRLEQASASASASDASDLLLAPGAWTAASAHAGNEEPSGEWLLALENLYGRELLERALRVVDDGKVVEVIERDGRRAWLVGGSAPKASHSSHIGGRAKGCLASPFVSGSYRIENLCSCTCKEAEIRQRMCKHLLSIRIARALGRIRKGEAGGAGAGGWS